MGRRIMNLSLVAVGSFTLFACVGLMWVARLQAQFLVYPGRLTPTYTPASVGMTDYQNLTLTTADGLELAAWYVPPPIGGGGAIVYTHGIGSMRDHWLGEARMLYDAGYGAIFFDFRNHGDSGGEVTTFGVQEVLDVRAAVDFLLARPEVDPQRIMLVGDSFGASTGLLATAQIPEIQGIVAVSPYASALYVVGDRARTDFRWPPRPTADVVLWWAARLSRADYYAAAPITAVVDIPPRPVWIVHGELDATTPVINAQRLYEVLGGEDNPDVTLWIVEGTGHSEMRVSHAAEFERRLLNFVNRVIGTR